MRKGYTHIFVILLVLSAILIIPTLLFGARQINYIGYGACVGNTLSDIDILIDQFKKTNSKTDVAVPVKVTDCIQEVVFTKKDWRSKAKGMKEVECRDDADAHILIFKRDLNAWSLIKSGAETEKIQAGLIAPDVICKNIYGPRFNILPADEKLEGPSGKNAYVVYCVKFQANPTYKYIDINNWDVVEAREKCVI